MPDAGAKKLGTISILFCATVAAGLACSQTRTPAARYDAVDPSIRPGDDFYGYANGVWIKAMRLPEGQSSIDSTSMLRSENARRVELLVADAVGTAARNPGASPNIRKIADYYQSSLTLPAIDARGMVPLAGELAAIAAIQDRSALAAYLGRTLRLDDGTNTHTESLWGLWVHQDFHDPHHYAAHIVQGGLGLVDRDDYLGASPEQAAHRTLYRTHVADLLRLAGLDRPDERAGRVLELETAIARTHASRADTDDAAKTDNVWHRADFAAKAPEFDWPAYFAAAHLNSADHFMVWQPQSVTGGVRLAASMPLDAWKDYLTARLIEHYADVLPQDVGRERRAFEARLSGASSSSPPPSAQHALAAVQDALGDAMARLYVDTYFSAQAKAAAHAMVANIRTAYRARLTRVAWMSPATKAKAIAKLSALEIGLGYPESWVDYSRLHVARGDAFGNFQRAEAFAYDREVAKLSRPIDPTSWPAQLHPQMVGAILDISPNSMEFAAGLFQPPYFDPAGDMAANYGSAGAGIAHEITHSFDELGNQYDAQGRLAPWWSKDDSVRYHQVADRLAAQLDAYCAKPDPCVHGKQVLAESAADLAGLAVAYDAYRLALHGRRDRIRHGLTGDQRFFVAYAQRWRRLQTDAALRRQIATDTHAPPEYRSDIVRNMPEWIRAFGVKPGDRLYLPPEARVRIW